LRGTREYLEKRMSGKHKKSQREKDITGRFLRGDV